MHVLSTVILVGLLACILIGGIYLRIAFRPLFQPAYLWFCLTCFFLAFYAAGELKMMHVDSVDEFARAIYWTHIPTWASHTAFALFVWSYFKAGRTWLLIGGIGLRTLAVIISLLLPFSINFTDITAIKHIEFLGDSVSVAVGTRNPLMTIGHVGTFLVLAYCIDTAISVWRRGDRELAKWFGGSVIIFVGARLIDTVLVMWGFVDFPLTTSPFFMGIVFVMAWEMGSKARRSLYLEEELKRKNKEFHSMSSALELVSNTGNIGMWFRDVQTGIMSVDSRCRRIFGFSPATEIRIESFHERLHPDDKEKVLKARETEFDNTNEVTNEYRILLPNGTTRWIRSRKRVVEIDGLGKIVYGAVADITRQMTAEIQAHDIGSSLIEVLETERARIARELHDDLGQSLALISVKMGMLNRSGETAIQERITELANSLDVISADVHRMSHELHPAKLEQLGLVATLRGFCREISETKGISIDLNCDSSASSITDDASLCIYRIAQEALQNIVKHSGAKQASVDLNFSGDYLVLTVTDKGIGFDDKKIGGKPSLGLISMRERMMSVGGTLNVRSSVGRGTTVEARIPLRKAIAAEARPRAASRQVNF